MHMGHGLEYMGEGLGHVGEGLGHVEEGLGHVGGGVKIHEAGGGATAHCGERELSGDKQEGNFDANAPKEMIEQNDAADNEEENGVDEQNEGEWNLRGGLLLTIKLNDTYQ